jgi:hypothetical protein
MGGTANITPGRHFPHRYPYEDDPLHTCFE